MTLVQESERDPTHAINSHINEINIGLRSPVPADQTQALLKFPILVHRFPFPVVINAIFSKIADLFRDGSNFQRLTTLHVCQQCAHHLTSGKVGNSDYIIKLVLGVCHSNDPSARALAVRLLASLPGLTADNRSVHSAILSALDSHWPAELDAAVWAINRLAPVSPALSRSAADRLAAAVSDLAIDPCTKLAMYAACCCLGRAGGEAIARLMDRLLGELADCPAVEGQSVLLRVLTRLALIAPDRLPRVLRLHCRRLLGDNGDAGDDEGEVSGEQRPRLRRILLANLLSLAGPSAAHHWTPGEARRLVQFLEAAAAADADATDDVEDGLRVAGALAAVDDAGRLLLDAGLLPLLRRIIYGGSGGVVVGAALDVAVRVAVATGDAELSEELACQLADRLPAAVATGPGPLDQLLGAWHALLGRFPQLGDVFFTSEESLTALLSGAGGNWRLGARAVRCLACITHRWRPRAAIADWLAGWLLEERRPQPRDPVRPDDDADQVEAACSLLFKAECCLHGRPDPRYDEAVLHSLAPLNCWQAYRVARSACKYGRLGLAGRIFAQLASAQERPAYWLRGLALLCRAEAAGTDDCTDPDTVDDDPLLRLDDWCERLREAVACLVSANGCAGDVASQAVGGGGGGSGGALWFPLAFAARRFNFVATCQSFAVLAYQLRPDGGRLAAVQLEAAAAEADVEAAAARKLRAACVDADAGSLAQLDCLAWQAAALAALMRALAVPRTATVAPPPARILAASAAAESADKDEGDDASSPGRRLPYACATQCERLQAIGDAAWDRLAALRRSRRLQDARPGGGDAGRALLLDTLWRLLRSPLCLPRFFFQRLQRTRINLHVTPAKKFAAEPETIPAGVDYALKVEGVVYQTGPQLVRRVASVAVVVAVRPYSPGDAGEPGGSGGWQQRLTATLPVPADYFSKEFVLSFDRRPSLYLIKVHVHPIDRIGAQWSAVEKERVFVRVAG